MPRNSRLLSRLNVTAFQCIPCFPEAEIFQRGCIFQVWPLTCVRPEVGFSKTQPSQRCCAPQREKVLWSINAYLPWKEAIQTTCFLPDLRWTCCLTPLCPKAEFPGNHAAETNHHFLFRKWKWYTIVLFFFYFFLFCVCFFVGKTTSEFLYHSLSWATIGLSQPWPLTTWGRRYNGVTAHFWFVIIPLQNSTCVSSTHECTVDLSLMINLSFPSKAAAVAVSSRPIFIHILFAIWTFRSF